MYVLYCIVLYCIVLCCVVLYCIVSYGIVSYRIVSYSRLSYPILFYSSLFCRFYSILLYYTLLYHIISYGVMSYYIIVCHIISYDKHVNKWVLLQKILMTYIYMYINHTRPQVVFTSWISKPPISNPGKAQLTRIPPCNNVVKWWVPLFQWIEFLDCHSVVENIRSKTTNLREKMTWSNNKKVRGSSSI